VDLLTVILAVDNRAKIEHMFDHDTAPGILRPDPAALGDDDLTAHLLAGIALTERATAAVLAALGEFDAR
jgi:hypothetical protein